MTKFKAGDRVVRTAGDWYGVIKGEEYTIFMIDKANGTVLLEHMSDYAYCVEGFKLTQRHKHYKMIMAWAEGEIIEFNDSHTISRWFEIGQGLSISWYPSYQYRIKPKKTQQQTEIEAIEKQMRELADRVKELKE